MQKYEHMCTHMYTQVHALKFTQKSMYIFTYMQSHMSLICRYTHTLTHALTLLDIYTQYRHTYILIYSLLRTYTYKNTHTCSLTCTHTPIHMHSHKHMHLSSLSHMHICTNMNICTHKSLHAHTHTLVTCVHIQENTYIYTQVHSHL